MDPHRATEKGSVGRSLSDAALSAVDSLSSNRKLMSSVFKLNFYPLSDRQSRASSLYAFHQSNAFVSSTLLHEDYVQLLHYSTFTICFNGTTKKVAALLHQGSTTDQANRVSDIGLRCAKRDPCSRRPSIWLFFSKCGKISIKY
ncbi:hypothetical protein TNCV_4183621 [Trichonephila clavipes]|nr:hypothetical protein TNCV_4183621 [Trichonephila clavipes]